MTYGPVSKSGPFWDFLAGRQPGPPAAATLGWTLRRVDPDRGEIEVCFDASSGFANPVGNVQGGFLAAMLDDTLGPALVATLPADQFAVTLDLNVSFLRPARPGAITGTGRVLHRGGSVAFLAGELRDDAGEILATATATARIIRPAAGATQYGRPAPEAAQDDLPGRETTLDERPGPEAGDDRRPRPEA